MSAAGASTVRAARTIWTANALYVVKPPSTPVPRNARSRGRTAIRAADHDAEQERADDVDGERRRRTSERRRGSARRAEHERRPHATPSAPPSTTSPSSAAGLRRRRGRAGRRRHPPTLPARGAAAAAAHPTDQPLDRGLRRDAEVEQLAPLVGLPHPGIDVAPAGDRGSVAERLGGRGDGERARRA